MIDRDLAELYGVSTKILNQAVGRNLERFPEGFMFRLTRKETKELVTNCDRFASLKHSSAAIQAFIRMRAWALTHEELSRKISALERKYDAQFKIVFDAMRDLMESPEKPRRAIGFKP